MCDGTIYCNTANIKLEGPSSVVISQDADANTTTFDTNLNLLSPQETNVSVKIYFVCKQSDTTAVKITAEEVPLNITACPLGFIYNSRSVCECAREVDLTNFCVQSSLEELVSLTVTGMDQ